MTKQIICDTVMFLSYIFITVGTAYSLIILPKKLKWLVGENGNLATNEMSQKYQKLYIKRFFVMLFLHVCSLVVDGVMCLLDGLSDTENGLIIPVWIFLSVSVVLILFFTVYSGVLRKRFKMATSGSGVSALGNWRTNCPVDLLAGILISFLFAFNSALIAYTIRLLIV